jgi:hypothetical protein
MKMNLTIEEFKVNDFITLRLENNTTSIFVNDQLFIHCKYLMLDIPINNPQKYEEISSIDEAKSLLSSEMEENEIVIDSETEFFGHCSNLQAWAENDYDTRLLDSNLAFPLLQKLVKVGDSLARMVFKDEIASRFQSKFPSTVLYLIENKYITYLNEEEIQTILDIIDFSNLKKHKTRAFLLILKELNDIGFKKAKSYFLEKLYSLAWDLTLEDIRSLIAQSFISLLDKKEFLNFSQFLVKEFHIKL